MGTHANEIPATAARPIRPLDDVPDLGQNESSGRNDPVVAPWGADLNTPLDGHWWRSARPLMPPAHHGVAQAASYAEDSFGSLASLGGSGCGLRNAPVIS